MTTAEVWLVRRSGGTLVDVQQLDASFGWRWQETINEPGDGAVVFDNQDPDLAAVDDGDFLQFRLDGQAAFTIQVGYQGPGTDREAGTIAESEEHDQTTTVAGPGHVTVLAAADVYPSRGPGALPPEEDRVFNWTAVVYDDSGWATAAQMMSVADAQGPAPGEGAWPYQPFGDGFPATAGAYMIWDSGSTSDLADEGDCYFRKTFTMPSPGWVVLYALIDNIGEVYLDGQNILQVEGFLHVSMPQPIELSAGEHLIAVHGHNYADDGMVGGNPGGIAIAVYQADASGTPRGAPLLVTDSSWKIEAYPAHPPGMTPGEVMRVCVDEAQTRGALPGVSLAFTDEEDSDGVAWPEVADIATKVGTDVLTFFREITATYVDMRMDPSSLELSAYVSGGLGADSSVVFEAGRNIVNLTHRRVGQTPVNVLLIKWHRGWSELINTASVAEHGRHEALLALGAAQSQEEALRVGTAQLDFYARPREEIAGDVEPGTGEVPWLAFTVGDSPFFPTRSGSSERARATSLTAAVDDDGQATFAVTAGDRLLSPAERWEQAINKMDAGTMRGTAVAATPASDIQFGPSGGPRGGATCCPPAPVTSGWALTIGDNGSIATDSESYTFDIDTTLSSLDIAGDLSGWTSVDLLVKRNGTTVQTVSLPVTGAFSDTFPVTQSFSEGDVYTYQLAAILDSAVNYVEVTNFEVTGIVPGDPGDAGWVGTDVTVDYIDGVLSTADTDTIPVGSDTGQPFDVSTGSLGNLEPGQGGYARFDVGPNLDPDNIRVYSVTVEGIKHGPIDLTAVGGLVGDEFAETLTAGSFSITSTSGSGQVFIDLHIGATSVGVSINPAAPGATFSLTSVVAHFPDVHSNASFNWSFPL